LCMCVHVFAKKSRTREKEIEREKMKERLGENEQQ